MNAKVPDIHQVPRRYTTGAYVCSLIVTGIGFSGVLGWLFESQVLIRVSIQYIPIAPSTSIAFMMLGSALFAYLRWQSYNFAVWFTRFAAGIVSLFGLVMLFQFLFGFDIGLESLLSPETEKFQKVLTGRMSPVTASCFLLAGLSMLLLIKFPFEWRASRNLSAGMSIVVVVTGLAITAGYFYGRPLLYGGTVIPVAFPTAVAFMFLGAGLLFASHSHLSVTTEESDVSLYAGRSFLRRYLPVMVVFFTGVLLSMAASAIVQKQEESLIHDEFERKATSLFIALKKNIDENLEVLGGVSALYSASVEVDRAEFKKFSSSILSHHQGIQAVEWVPHVSEGERPIYEKNARKDGFPDFRFVETDLTGSLITAKKRREYFPVYFVEPLKGNEKALGFDLGSQETRLKALEKARDTGEMTATGRIKLVQETGHQYGFLVFNPVYQKGKRIGTVDERRRSLAGFVLGVFSIGDIVQAALKGLYIEGIGLQISDTSAEEKESLLYVGSGNQVQKGVRWGSSLNIADRKWLVEFYRQADTYSRGAALGVMAAGFIFTILLGTYLLTLERYNLELEYSKKEIRLNEARQEKLIIELQEALAKIKTLSGMLPICASCKKIRDDKGYWNQIEVYIREHSEAEFTHGLCPVCAKKYYEEWVNFKKQKE